MEHPVIIQGGMGIGISDWRLARAVARKGQMGVVSGTALDSVLARRLQMGDPGGHMRRGLAHFPAPQIARRVQEKYYIPGGKAPDRAFAPVPVFSAAPPVGLVELTLAANFVEVFLAKEGHDGPVGINLMEKIQLPNLISLYGAMLAGVDYVLMGAGIPREIPGVLDALGEHAATWLKLHVEEAESGDDFRLHFDPKNIIPDALPPLKRPYFLPIISSVTLALSLAKKANGRVDGFIVEGPIAGGHNAPPRGALRTTVAGEPIYGPKDAVDIGRLRRLGLPFWQAGGYAHPDKVRQARDGGAAGVQVGTAFMLCRESGLDAQVKERLIGQLQRGEIRIFTDPSASPTGFPFKVVQMEDSLAVDAVYQERPRRCDLGYLQVPYKKADGSLGRRCPSEPERAFSHKGGAEGAVEGRKCLCNALLANIGLPQVRRGDYVEPTLVTAGEDLTAVKHFLAAGNNSYGAAEVVDYLLSETRC
ncbi:MAG: nitronate monooxygenase [Candidatus Latescibacteria bacterium]|nr:nitronate monooxygenase [Candidatus Latescibacterota bacterium]